ARQNAGVVTAAQVVVVEGRDRLAVSAVEVHGVAGRDVGTRTETWVRCERPGDIDRAARQGDVVGAVAATDGQAEVAQGSHRLGDGTVVVHRALAIGGERSRSGKRGT